MNAESSCFSTSCPASGGVIVLGCGYSDRCVVATHVLLCFNLHVPNGILKKELYLAIVMNLKLSIFNFSIISVSDFAICSDEPTVHTILLDL